MLQFISWKMYGISLIVGLVFFYGYVGYKNFRLFTRLAGRLWAAANKGGRGLEKKEAEPEREPPELEQKEGEEPPKRGKQGAGGWKGIKALVLPALLLPGAVWAQTADGAAGINQANSMVRSYFDPAVNLMYAAGALAGIVGGYKVYRAMNHKDHDADNRAMAWFAGCIFLVLVATVLKSFFGI